ncbi:hypothetical protein [Colwellia sp. TT2012]|uniref:hypothetical protein n=1 Tax=Colwellia sp. TT2012 TaxID=1720342 RepID=UPI000AFAA46B|nr:hypothetical protein [Colwellia sp. TT2012]
MAKSNYNYEKRQRELAKKKKKEEKRLKKLEKVSEDPSSDEPLLADDENTSI